MNKTYTPSEFEEKIYKEWMQKGYFKANINKKKKPFTIVMPPPNVTSKLHMGHAFQQTIQDIIIRRKRMQGFEACWLPGTDHAAIATEAKIVEKLAKAGIKKEDIGRESFQVYVDEWYKEYKDTIINQFKRMGFSCDWDRLAFTMDETNCRAVKKVFVHLYKKGWIYRGSRIVNWCTTCKSSISDIEVEFKESRGNLWYVKYPIENSNDFITIATTRPETILGDTAVAVNPSDKRYKNIIGKNLILPLVGKKIPLIADDYADAKFGSGAVKITPAHDPNDYEVGQRHKLESVRVMEDDGTMSPDTGKYAGLKCIDARKLIVEDLKTEGYLVKIEDYTHNVGHCDRCKTVIEPLISPQWYVKMSELAKPAIEVVENDTVHFMEERFKKIYLHWMKNIKDWCISRQIWSGHRIPVFTCENCGEVIVELTDPTVCPKCKSKKLTQEVDTLDTWFSSALWPLSTLGWPDTTADLDYFYPTNVMVTAQEIIQLWVARMIFSGIEYVGKIPFTEVLINGTVKDAAGKKMSKSLGNGVDPNDIIDKYGVDTLRFSVFNGIAIDKDMKFSEKKVELSRNFLGKVWNASKFVLMKIESIKVKDIKDVKLGLADKWLLNELNALIKSVDKKFEKYDLGMAASELYDFFWNKFCDWYIELSKVQFEEGADESTAATLTYVLTTLLKLLHPFIPFITEEIYLNLPGHGESIMISDWPLANPAFNVFKSAKTQIEGIMNIIKAVRNERAEKNIPDNKKIVLQLLPLADKTLLQQCSGYIKKLTLAESLTFIDKPNTDNCVTIVFDNAKIFIPMASLVDEAQEKERLKKELIALESEISRGENMLANAGFVAKAPKTLIDAEKEKLAKNKELKAMILKSL